MQIRKYALSVLVLTLVAIVLPSDAVWAGEVVEEGIFGFVNATLAPDFKYLDAGGYFNNAGEEKTSGVELRCVSEDNDFVFYCEVDHPDSVRVKRETSTIEQSAKDNAVIVGIEGTVATIDTDTICSCERAEHKGKVNTKALGRLKLKCEFRECDCFSGLTSEQVDAVGACFANSGTKTLRLKGEKSEILDGKLEGRGSLGAPPSS